MTTMIANCGQDCDKKTAGICFIDNGLEINMDDLHTLVESTESELERIFEKDFNIQRNFKKNDVVVEFVDGEMFANCHYLSNSAYSCKRPVYGINVNGVYIVIEWEKCMGQTSFVHELLHSVENFVFNRSHKQRSNHEFPFFDDHAENKYEAIENSARIKVINQLASCEE